MNILNKANRNSDSFAETGEKKGPDENFHRPEFYFPPTNYLISPKEIAILLQRRLNFWFWCVGFCLINLREHFRVGKVLRTRPAVSQSVFCPFSAAANKSPQMEMLGSPRRSSHITYTPFSHTSGA